MTSTVTRRATEKTQRAKPLSSMTVDQNALNIEYVSVDAEQAEEWLQSNANNRGQRKVKIAEFKSDMLAGNWRNIGDPVRFDTGGRLVDGQHRLIALVRANEEREAECLKTGEKYQPIAVPLLVIRGVAPEDQIVMDTGTRRTAADQLRIVGRHNYILLSAAAKWMIFWERQALYADNTKKFATHTEIVQFVEEHSDFEEIVSRAARLIKGIKMPPGYVCTAYYICWRIDPDVADEFFQRLSDGEDLKRGDPILALRNRLEDLRHSRVNLSGEMWLSLLLRTWNARREGQSLRAVMVQRRGEAIACPMPI
jgi:hypothetical protein